MKSTYVFKHSWWEKIETVSRFLRWPIFGLSNSNIVLVTLGDSGFAKLAVSILTLYTKLHV